MDEMIINKVIKRIDTNEIIINRITKINTRD